MSTDKQMMLIEARYEINKNILMGSEHGERPVSVCQRRNAAIRFCSEKTATGSGGPDWPLMKSRLIERKRLMNEMFFVKLGSRRVMMSRLASAVGIVQNPFSSMEEAEKQLLF